MKTKTRHYSKFFALLLAMLLVVGMLPTTVFAEGEVTEVAINVKAPVAGETPSEPNVTLPENADYTISGARWATEGGSDISGKFISGMTYKSIIRLEAKMAVVLAKRQLSL